MARERLSEYRRKRTFSETPEPPGDERGVRAGHAEAEPGADGPGDHRSGQEDARFVIQQHDATRLHWDLRLEYEGALLSWALPRGVPDDPDDDRLAVRTEEHPLSYLDFQGEIPAGQYGAGRMTIWDRGTYRAEKITDGKVVAVLDGGRVKGRYALFRMRDRDWLIHRMDPPADPDREPLPEPPRPMAATPGQLPDDEGDWGFELLWRGVRAFGLARPGELRILSAGGDELTSLIPEVRRFSRALGATEALLDGMLVAFDAEGRPDADRIARRTAAASDSTARRRARDVPATYVAFDLLHLNGRRVADDPYASRREMLEGLVEAGPAWQAPGYHRGDGEALLSAARERGLAGVVAKCLSSPYRPGRSGDWVEVAADNA